MRHQSLFCLLSVMILTVISGAISSPVTATPAAGDIITVGKSGGTSFTIIQEAIDAASDGDELIVFPATYYENIDFMGKNIILRSSDPTSRTIVETTVIDAQSSGSVVTFSGAEGTTCVLSGFTITGGASTIFGGGFLDESVYLGGGIQGAQTHATIENNIITSNSVNYRGGGIADCYGLIQFNTISDNWAVEGGGLFGCNGPIRFNKIYENHAVEGGGLNNCHMMESNDITSNTAVMGGGLAFCHSIIQDNRITTNTAEMSGGGLYRCNGQILYNEVMGNQAGISGGGFEDCSGKIAGNYVANNYAGESGGGFSNCHGRLYSNFVVQNEAELGGGFADSNGSMHQNTVADNRATTGGGFYLCKGSIKSCIIWGNVPDQVYESSHPGFSCIQDWPDDHKQNISDDPLFVDPANGDYHLQPDSPCIDAGAFASGVTADIDGEARPFHVVAEALGDGSKFDIGADEYVDVDDIEGEYGDFVDQLYRDFLRRESELDGRWFYINHLAYGEMTLGEITRNFIESPEFADYNGFLSRCYMGLFNDNSTMNFADAGFRIPDYGGMTYWRDEMSRILNEGGDVYDAKLFVLYGFLASDEWIGSDPALSDAEFVELLYRRILGRAPDAGGFNHNLANLAHGVLSRQELALFFLESPEARARYRSHTYVTMAYLGLLQRTPDRGGFAFHMNNLIERPEAVFTLLHGFLNSPEYRQRLAAQGVYHPGG